MGDIRGFHIRDNQEYLTTFTITAAFEVVIWARTTFASRTFLSTARILATANLPTGKSVYLTLIENTSIKQLEDLDNIIILKKLISELPNSYHSIDVLSCTRQTRCSRRNR